MRSKRTVNKSNKFPMPLHHEQNDKPSLDTMPMQHKGDGKSSLDLMELHQKELDRSSLEPLSFGFTYDAPSYQSSLDLNPVWNHFHVALVLVFQATNPVWIQCKGLQWNCPQRRRQIQSGTTLIWLCFWYSKLPIQCGAKPSLDPMQVHHKGAGKSSLDPMELHHKEGDRSSLESLSFSITSGTPSYQSTLDPMEVHHEGAYKSSLDPMELHDKEGDSSSLEPLSFGITSGTPSYQSCLDPNPVWIQRQCAIKEMANPV